MRKLIYSLLKSLLEKTLEALTDADRLFTLHEVAYMLGVSYWTVYRWVKSGKIKGVKIPSGRWRVPKSALEEFFKEVFREGEV